MWSTGGPPEILFNANNLIFYKSRKRGGTPPELADVLVSFAPLHPYSLDVQAVDVGGSKVEFLAFPDVGNIVEGHIGELLCELR